MPAVAKLFAALQTRNYRIRLSGALNRCCALAHDLESILRAPDAQNSFATQSGAKRTRFAHSEFFAFWTDCVAKVVKGSLWNWNLK